MQRYEHAPRNQHPLVLILHAVGARWRFIKVAMERVARNATTTAPTISAIINLLRAAQDMRTV